MSFNFRKKKNLKKVVTVWAIGLSRRTRSSASDTSRWESREEPLEESDAGFDLDLETPLLEVGMESDASLIN